MSASATTQDVPLHKKVVFSGISGSIATTCIYPIDLVKTKLQDQKGGVRLYENPVHCFKTIFKNNGLRGLYQGWPPNVILVMPEKALKLTLNDVFRAEIRKRREKHDLPFLWEMAAGGAAGFCQVIMTNPMELLKIQGATMAEKIRSGELKSKPSYMSLVRQLGVTGLYTGVLATLSRDVPFSMIYFSLYSQTKEWLLSDPSATGSLGLRSFASGAIAGTIAAAVTCPIDVIKTRVHSAARPQKIGITEYFQREPKMIREQWVKLMSTEGTGALFKGVVPRCLIISPLFAITMSCYEKFQQMFG